MRPQDFPEQEKEGLVTFHLDECFCVIFTLNLGEA
jgi:hypothetical protein